MRKSLLFLAASAVAVSASSTVAVAVPKQKCYNLGPFSDVLRLVFDDKVKGHQSIYGQWEASGFYVFPVNGAYETDVDGVARRISLVGSTSGSENGNVICSVDGVVNGSFNIECAGGSSNFQNSNGPITKVSCNSSAVSRGHDAALLRRAAKQN